MTVVDKNFEHLESIEIKGYDFSVFKGSKKTSEIQENVVFQNFEKKIFKSEKEKIIELDKETKSEHKSGFKVSAIVKEHRGLREQENLERERRIALEVERRVNKIEEDAFQQGFNHGIKVGKEEAIGELKEVTANKIIALEKMINNVQTAKSSIIKNQKEELVALIRDLVKWIILRELKDDGKYLHKLLEKLILEADTKNNLLLQVNQQDFEHLPEVLEVVQKKLGELPNLRVVVDYDMEHSGIVLNTDNGIFCATIEEQFNALNNLFESVEINGSDEDQGGDVETE